MNKKSVYRQIKITEVKDLKKQQEQTSPQMPDYVGLDGDQALGTPKPELISNKMIAEKMVERNLSNNVDQLQHELDAITKQVRNMMDYCDKQLDEVIDQVEANTKM